MTIASRPPVYREPSPEARPARVKAKIHITTTSRDAVLCGSRVKSGWVLWGPARHSGFADATCATCYNAIAEAAEILGVPLVEVSAAGRHRLARRDDVLP